MSARAAARRPSGLRRAVGSVLLLALAVSGPACRQAIVAPAAGGVQTGIASWYGPGFHGRRTSNREIYDMYDVTAAHRTLPFGTLVMVTNISNGRSAIVRVNDRGPFVGNRIIDLSYSAACLLDMVGPGTARVRLDVLKSPPPRTAAPAGFSVQVGAFTSRAKAVALVAVLEPEFKGIYVAEFATPAAVYYRVRVRARDRAEARRLAERLADKGYPIVIFEGE